MQLAMTIPEGATLDFRLIFGPSLLFSKFSTLITALTISLMMKKRKGQELEKISVIIK